MVRLNLSFLFSDQVARGNEHWVEYLHLYKNEVNAVPLCYLVSIMFDTRMAFAISSFSDSSEEKKEKRSPFTTWQVNFINHFDAVVAVVRGTVSSGEKQMRGITASNNAFSQVQATMIPWWNELLTELCRKKTSSAHSSMSLSIQRDVSYSKPSLISVLVNF